MGADTNLSLSPINWPTLTKSPAFTTGVQRADMLRHGDYHLVRRRHDDGFHLCSMLPMGHMSAAVGSKRMLRELH